MRDFVTAAVTYLGDGFDSDTSIRQLLAEGTELLKAAGLGASARPDAELLLMHASGMGRPELITSQNRSIAAEAALRYREGLRRRAMHEPIQYILGQQEFFGLTFRVNPAVLIPRPETEHLVEAALDRIDKHCALRIADVGTGSGAIAIALAHSLPLAQITALDISPAALEVARENAERNQVSARIRFLESDLLQAVAGNRFNMIVSNPPYIPDSDQAELEPQVRDFEPASALFAGPTGLEIYQRLVPQAWNCLAPGGWLLMEVGAGQNLKLMRLLIGWDEVHFVPDLQGIPRVAMARVPERREQKPVETSNSTGPERDLSPTCGA